jgi:hypothetical protein
MPVPGCGDDSDQRPGAGQVEVVIGGIEVLADDDKDRRIGTELLLRDLQGVDSVTEIEVEDSVITVRTDLEATELGARRGRAICRRILSSGVADPAARHHTVWGRDDAILAVCN